jgi:hypothetical protein
MVSWARWKETDDWNIGAKMNEDTETVRTIHQQLVDGIKAEVRADKLERTLTELLERLKKVVPTKATKVDYEVAIFKAEITLSAIKEVKKL